MPIELVTLDQEKIKRTLDKVGVDPRVIDVILELHDTQRATEKAVNELLAQQGKVVEGLQLLNLGFGKYADRLKKIEGKYSDPNRDLIATEKLDG